MPATRILFELMGSVALLMWGIHMVSHGVRRAFGSDLRRLLGLALRNRFTSFAAGLTVTAALQSSTATALLVTSLSGAAGVDLVPSLATMLGANVGTTLITQILTFDITYVYPVLVILGVGLARRGRAGHVRDLGQALLGIGLMLLSLHLLLHALRPIETSATVRGLFAALAREPLLALAAATLFAWAAHSSVAAVLLTASLSASGLIPPGASFAMVIGCNLGSALNPLAEARGGDPARLRIALGNLLTRFVGLLALPFAEPVSALVLHVDPSMARLPANLHLLFNLALAALFIFVLPAVANILTRVCPDRPGRDAGAAQYLDEAALSTPSVALANASREVLRMADIVETMLSGSRDAFRRDDREKIMTIGQLDDGLDRLFVSVQGYLGLLAREPMTSDETRRMAAITSLAINLEHVGDIVEKNLMEMAAKRIEKGHRLPPDALSAVADLHDRLLDHLRLALAVFMSGDIEAARLLVAEKEKFRDVEREATERHFDQMRSGRTEVIQTSALQLDIVRDLKRIEAHIAATAHGLLEESGALSRSRLVN